MRMSRVYFAGNRASQGYGGGVWAQHGTLNTSAGCNFSRNVATRGSDIYVHAQRQSLTGDVATTRKYRLFDTVFERGGTVYLEQGTSTLQCADRDVCATGHRLGCMLPQHALTLKI